MTHPDFDPAWLDEDLDEWAERALKADERSRPGSVRRIRQRNRYLLSEYLDAIQIYGYDAALDATIKLAESEGHADFMVRDAIKPWSEAHPKPRSRDVGEVVIELEASTADLRTHVHLIEEWIARRNAEASAERIIELKARFDAFEAWITAHNTRHMDDHFDSRIFDIEARLSALEASRNHSHSEFGTPLEDGQ